jgi:drug/metabolite transporter (DMT)-like permease
MDWLWLLILSGICTVYAFSVSVELMRRITAFAVNLTVNLEPVYGIILAVLILGEKEKMTAGFYYGTLIILISVLIYPVYNFIIKRKMPKRMFGA